MGAVYNPEAEIMAQIEKLEITARELRRRLQEATLPQDRRVIERQLQEVEAEIEQLRRKLP